MVGNRNKCACANRADAAPTALFHPIKLALEEYLQSAMPAGDDPADMLSQAMRHAVLSPGKRLRPMLLLTIGYELGCYRSALMDLACALELVHAASLVLDDLPCMDDARLRRGQPTIHRRFGQDIAVLTAVCLLSQAFRMVSEAQAVPPETRARLVGILAHAVGAQGLAKGQYQDLHADASRSVAEIATTNMLKTSALLGAAVEMATVVAHADEHVAQALRDFADAAGQAFQIGDDFLDQPDSAPPMHRPAMNSGKDIGQDTNKSTLLNRLGAEDTRDRMTGLMRQAYRHLRSALGPRNQTLRMLSNLVRN